MSEPCGNLRGLFDLYLENELSGEDRNRVLHHLEQCYTCRTELESEEMIERQLAALPEFTCPDALVHQIEAAIHEDKRNRERSTSWWRSLLSLRYAQRGAWRFAVGFAGLVILWLVVWSPFDRDQRQGPTRHGSKKEYTQQEILQARRQAQASLIYTAHLINQSERNAIREVLAAEVPAALETSVKKSIRKTLSEL